jgi:hypothetical protein
LSIISARLTFEFCTWFGGSLSHSIIQPSFFRKGLIKTASGSSFNRNLPTAAHRSLPLGTRVRVTDLATNRSVVVVITDRGPRVRDRVLDLRSAQRAAWGLRIVVWPKFAPRCFSLCLLQGENARSHQSRRPSHSRPARALVFAGDAGLVFAGQEMSPVDAR